MLTQRNAFVLLFAPDSFKLFGEVVRIYFCTCFEKDKNLVKDVSVYRSRKTCYIFPSSFLFLETFVSATSI
jgi:hypothetical protein